MESNQSNGKMVVLLVDHPTVPFSASAVGN
jgi:hypothetical protein